MPEKDRDANWYKQVLDSMADLVLVKGDRARLLWANKAFLDYYGMTNEELEDIVDSPHSDPDDTVQYVKDDHYVYTTGKVLDIPSEPITDSRGEVRYHHTIKTPVFDDENRVTCTVGVSRLIVDDTVVSSSIRDREARKRRLGELRTLVHHMPMAVAMFDVKSRFLAYSLAWRDLFHSEREELAGAFYDEEFGGCLALDDAIARALGDNRQVQLAAVAMRSLAGAARVVDVEIRPWALPSGALGGTIVLIRDITDMMAAQDALRRANEELSQFNYRVSHDLLAPLKTVRGFIDLCEEELGDGNLDEVREYLGVIRENVVQLGSLVEDVLDLARADVQVAETTDIDIEDLVRGIVDKHAADIAAAAISVSIRCQARRVHTTRIRVLQVVDNLISNAVKYFDPDKGERYIQVTTRDDGAKGLHLAVRDNGIGFDADQVESIFGIFKRASSKHPGSGLGLYIVKKHLDYLGGNVVVLSNRDDTVFEVSIPRASERAHA